MGRTQNHWPPFLGRLIRQRQRQSCIGKPSVLNLYLPILPSGGLFASRIWVHGACPEKFIVLGYLASTNVKSVSESLILTRSQGCGWTATMSSLCGWWLTALGALDSKLDFRDLQDIANRYKIFLFLRDLVFSKGWDMVRPVKPPKNDQNWFRIMSPWPFFL